MIDDDRLGEGVEMRNYGLGEEMRRAGGVRVKG